ncbi:hypothetical protein T440DRAFT_201087 [Plenodomus tracheiphilus IPT5]|uniref:Uncharacterized protein n=1 Tax=Plenodomus tracheiphilus IPT5 TaxID=1408161 RepID=A0A6A7BJR2_9PLEO|nr:hypothetical protein T440DRAFT_201087 [Plenodomus tracheiphilus IPT5]
MGSRKYYLSLVGLVAWSGTAANAIFAILETAAFSNTKIPLVPATAAATVLNLLSLCSIGMYCYSAVWRMHGPTYRSPRVRRLLVAGSTLVSSAALIASLILIILIKSRWKELLAAVSTAPVTSWNSLVTGQIAVWAIACISQVVLYLSQVWRPRPPKLQPIVTSGPRDSVMSEHRPVRPNNLYMSEHPRPVMTLGALPSPTFSTRSSQSLRSFRDSLRHVVRPVTSRSTLISRHSANRDARSVYSDRQSVDNMSHPDPFDSWDTSSVSLQVRDAVMHTAPSKGTVLEPILGSRPNSPARALDGPFMSGLPEEEVEELAPPPRMMPDISRPPSPAVSEAHIHPLFRTATPEPAPVATLGTSIVASPLANQAITCPAPTFNRMRSNSRGVSPSPLNQPRSFTRDRASSLPTRSRSSSPPTRGMTPPIPDFVLNSSPRSSMSGSRRVNLHASSERG